MVLTEAHPKQVVGEMHPCCSGQSTTTVIQSGHDALFCKSPPYMCTVEQHTQAHTCDFVGAGARVSLGVRQQPLHDLRQRPRRRCDQVRQHRGVLLAVHMMPAILAPESIQQQPGAQQVPCGSKL